MALTFVLSEGGELISKSSRELLPLTLTIGLNNQTPTRAHWALHWISLGCVRRVSVGLVGTFSAGLHQGSERASGEKTAAAAALAVPANSSRMRLRASLLSVIYIRRAAPLY